MSCHELAAFAVVTTCCLSIWLLLRNYRWTAVRLSQSLTDGLHDADRMRGSWYVRNITTTWGSRAYHIMEISLPVTVAITMAAVLVPSSGYELAWLMLILTPLLVVEGFTMGSRVYRMRQSSATGEEEV